MNERIKELAVQAGLKIEYQMINPPKPFQILSSVEQFEKFAELIVRECVDIAYEYDAPKMSGPGMIIGNRIEEHFGVEE